jgi:hypothetical protein
MYQTITERYNGPAIAGIDTKKQVVMETKTDMKRVADQKLH